MTDLFWIPFAFFLVAVLYGAVGHGGASGYLALMALLSFAPEVLRPTALVLNLAVSALAGVFFFRAGHFRWSIFWPFAVASIPFAWLGARVHLPPNAFRILLGFTLVFAAFRLLLPSRQTSAERPAPLVATLPLGALLGFLSGLVGVGGGIFLTPLLVLSRWADARVAAAVSAPFIFVNSAAGLAGQAASLHRLPPSWPALAIAVVAGGALGAAWGSGRARIAQLRPVLALVLAVASAKLLFA